MRISEAKQRAVALLDGKVSTIRGMIDRSSDYNLIDFNLTELKIQQDFALSLDLITDDQYQKYKDKWYHFKEILNTLYE